MNLRAVAAALALAGCGAGQSGITPPMDRIFLPSALQVSETARWMYVVNSNSDLRFNEGTVVAVNLDVAAVDRSADWPLCPSATYLPTGPAHRQCCRDALDDRILNCDERPYVAADTTVGIGTFGSSLVAQPYTATDGRSVERLFVGVRSDPSITFIDVIADRDQVSMRCRGPRTGSPAAGQRHASCDANWKMTDVTLRGEVLPFPQEPYALTLDAALGILYVAHIRGGLSVVDVCAPERAERPRFGDNTYFVFSPEPVGVTSIAPWQPGNPRAPLYATSRYSAELGEVVLDGPGAAGCPSNIGPEAPVNRGLSLKVARRIAVPEFYPRGADIRGVIVPPREDRLSADVIFVLHRNSPAALSGAIQESVAAVARLDTHPDEQGRPSFQVSATVEVGSQPIAMAWHDAGRGPRIFVTCFGAGQIWIVDPETMAIEGIVDIGRGPAALVFNPPGGERAIGYVAGFSDNNVSVLDLRPGSPTEYRVIQRIGFPHPSSKNGS